MPAHSPSDISPIARQPDHQRNSGGRSVGTSQATPWALYAILDDVLGWTDMGDPALNGAFRTVARKG